MIQIKEEPRLVGITLPFRPPRIRSSNDPLFPYGTPEELDYSMLDQTGVELIKEINRHPWIATADYCSGHPSDRPPTEETSHTAERNKIITVAMPTAFRWDFWEELQHLTDHHRKGQIGRIDYMTHRTLLLECSKATLYFDAQVSVIRPFFSWMKLVYNAFEEVFMGLPFYSTPVLTTDPLHKLLRIHFSFDYYGVAHRETAHNILLNSLMEFPI